MADFTIDPEFRDLLPQLGGDEQERLSDDISANGCRDALVVWEQTGILLDGHRRHGICQQLGIPFHTTRMSFESRDHAKQWVFSNQLARRNLTDFQKAEIAMRMKPILQHQAKLRRGHHLDPSVPAGKTRDALGQLAGISGRTISKVEVILEKATPELVAQVRSGTVTIEKAFGTVRPPIERASTAWDKESRELVAEVQRTCDQFRKSFGETRLKLLASTLHKEAIATRELSLECAPVK